MCARILQKLYQKKNCYDFLCSVQNVLRFFSSSSSRCVPSSEWFHANIQSNGMKRNGLECVSTCSHVNRLNHSFRITIFFFACFEFFFHFPTGCKSIMLFYYFLLFATIFGANLSHLFFVVSVFAFFVYSV